MRSLGQAPLDAVAELRAVSQAEREREGVVGEAPQGHDDAQFAEERKLSLKVGIAVVALLGRRLVAGWGAAHGGGDVGAVELEAVVAADAVRLIRVAGAVEGAEEPVAGAVAGEDAPRAVAAVGSGRQAEGHQLGARVAEAGQRAPPVGPFAKGGALLLRDLLAPPDEARALPAVHYVVVELLPGVHKPSLAPQATPPKRAISFACHSIFM